MIGRQTLRWLFKVVAIGAAGGPVIAVVLGWLFGTSRTTFSSDPVPWLAQMAYIGVVFALSFGLLCGPPVLHVWRRAQGLSPWGQYLLVALMGFCGGSLAFLIARSALSWTFSGIVWGPPPLGTLLLIDGVLAAGIALAISVHERVKAERDAAHSRARAAVLTAQIRPHFLFNVLNAISAQVLIDPAAAQENLARVADLFRYAIKHTANETVALADELELAREYLLLEQIRYGTGLRFELPAPVDLRLPPLTLQPLVENAVRHGISKRREGGLVRVSVARRGGSWFLTVANPTETSGRVPDRQLFREGHALWVLRQRYRALVVRQEPIGCFEVEVQLT